MEKINKNKNQIIQKNDIRFRSQSIQFKDNRPEHSRQLKVQRMANQVVQRKESPTNMFNNGKLHREKLSVSQNNPVQLVSIGNTYKTSENTNYRTKKADSNYLGVKSAATKPVPSGLIQATGNKTSGFDEYTFNGGNFQNDCLQFAQRLGLNIAGRQADEILRVKVGGAATNVGFAITKPPLVNALVGTPNTTDIADKQGFDRGENANPGIGETYAIVPKTGAQVQGCSFHISTVVAKDGGDNITCEADAGNQQLAAPVFDIYETAAGNQLTFHARYKDQYGGQYAATGILAPPTDPRSLADATFP